MKDSLKIPWLVIVNDLTKFYYLHYVIYLHNRFSFDFHISIVFHYKIKQTTPTHTHTLGASIKRNIQTYGGEDQTYIDVTIYVYMQRRALYYMFNIIIPCMIMSMMALLVFTLPPEANEKIVLGKIECYLTVLFISNNSLLFVFDWLKKWAPFYH